MASVIPPWSTTPVEYTYSPRSVAVDASWDHMEQGDANINLGYDIISSGGDREVSDSLEPLIYGSTKILRTTRQEQVTPPLYTDSQSLEVGMAGPVYTVNRDYTDTTPLPTRRFVWIPNPTPNSIIDQAGLQSDEVSKIEYLTSEGIKTCIFPDVYSSVNDDFWSWWDRYAGYEGTINTVQATTVRVGVSHDAGSNPMPVPHFTVGFTTDYTNERWVIETSFDTFARWQPAVDSGYHPSLSEVLGTATDDGTYDFSSTVQVPFTGKLGPLLVKVPHPPVYEVTGPVSLFSTFSASGNCSTSAASLKYYCTSLPYRVYLVEPVPPEFVVPGLGGGPDRKLTRFLPRKR